MSDSARNVKLTVEELKRKLSRAAQLEEEQKVVRGGNGVAPSNAGVTDGAENEQDTETALAAVKLRIQSLKAENRKQDMQLRKRLATWAIVFVGMQLLVSNWFFYIFIDNNKESPSSEVMIAWLSASVIEVIGILLVIARSLFPVKETKPEKDAV